jgi:hypothetical protein
VSDKSIPLWLRVLDAVANRAERAARLVGAIRDETVIAWTRPDDRTRLTSALFDRQRTYLPGGNTFAHGLFYWEREMLVSPFPQQGRLLVGGAGGGREATVFADRGYASWAGILRMSSIEEVGSVARSAGYRVEKHGSAPGRMLLVPADRSSGVP